jgi:hypothetical protein
LIAVFFLRWICKVSIKQHPKDQWKRVELKFHCELLNNITTLYFPCLEFFELLTMERTERHVRRKEIKVDFIQISSYMCHWWGA